MPRDVSSSAALPIARAALQIVIVLNWLPAAVILAFLLVMPTRWIVSAFELAPSPEADRLVWGLRAIAGLGLAIVLLNYVVLRRLLAIVATVRAGDPFVAENADRLQAIAWALLAVQLLSLVVAAIAKAVTPPAHPLHFHTGFSVNGWLVEGTV